jgi:hypothetical protein
MSKAQVAKELDVSTRTITRRVKPTLRVGGQNRYYMSDVVAQLRKVPPQGGDVVRFPVERTKGAAA